MTPYEAIRKGLIPGTIPEPFWTVTTTDTTQNWSIALPAGKVYVVDWGDGQQTWHTGTAALQAIAHTYASAGTYTIKVYLDPTVLTYAYANSNSLSGSAPNLANTSALVNFRCTTNTLVGSLPVSPSAGVLELHFNANQFSGSIPDLSTNVALKEFYCHTNLLTGNIPDLSANVALQYFYCYGNQITGYTPSVLSATFISFRADNNALTQAAVDAILADFATNVAARPAVGTINLSGGTNAAPSAAGLASKAAILLAKPGWTITHA